MMKKTILAAAAMALGLGSASVQAASFVEGRVWTPQEIAFGKQYNDHVMAIRVDSGIRERDRVPLQARYPTGNTLRLAQGEVSQDPGLVAALKIRGIATHNVLWVQTALNGGKIVYYR